MTPLDWGIIIFALVLALWGFGQGLLVSALTMGGFIGGAVLGSRIAPLLLSTGAESPYTPLLSLVFALMAGIAAATLFGGLGKVLQSAVSWGPIKTLDAVGGTVLGAALALGLAWVLGAVALQTPQVNKLRELVQRSLVLQELNDRLPPSAPILNALARVDPFPQITGPSANVPAPTSDILGSPNVKRAADSVVRVLGTACGLGVQGSGWVVRERLVVTNAHVVAGQYDTTVQTATDGRKLSTTVVHFDVKNDLAILRVAALAKPALDITATADAGTSVAVIGYPENGLLTATPARIGQTGTVASRDAYGRGPVSREITSFRGEVRHGNSGGPAVDSSGIVLTTVFAASTDGNKGFGVPNGIVRSALNGSNTKAVGTGPCVG